MRNGLTLWDNLCYIYNSGVEDAWEFVDFWQKARPYIDSERYERLLKRFERQAKDAEWWRDACLLYFQRYSRRSIPADCLPPVHKLEDLMKFKLHIDNYTVADMDNLPYNTKNVTKEIENVT